MKITLCGSTRFKEEWAIANAMLTLAGHVVYSVAMWSHGDKIDPSPAEKQRLDLVHLMKINASDAIFVLDVDGYIGESTKREIEWARLRGKLVYYLSSDFDVSNLFNINDLATDFFELPRDWVDLVRKWRTRSNRALTEVGQ